MRIAKVAKKQKVNNLTFFLPLRHEEARSNTVKEDN